MKLNRSDRQIAGVASVAFAFIAMVLAFSAVVIATNSESRSDAANARIAKLASTGVIGSTAKITLEEFSIAVHPGLVQSGKVTLRVENVGSITHELVIVRAASPAALPRVKTAGERSVGAVNEEAIPESAKMGESGDCRGGRDRHEDVRPPARYLCRLLQHRYQERDCSRKPLHEGNGRNARRRVTARRPTRGVKLER